jgi:hypothetical protein
MADLRINPFAVAPEEPQAVQKDRQDTSVADETRLRRIRDAASRLVLGSVMLAKSRGLAVISGKVCRVGDAVDGFRVEAIEARGVRLSCEGETVDLRLTPEAKSAATGGPDGR